jgi:peptidoglycan/xylan/chitin deacetylase (PgdA/CDA1 family)
MPRRVVQVVFCAILGLSVYPNSTQAEEMELPALEIEGRGTTLLFAGPKDKNVVALTFDDGPHPTKTTQILDTLKRERIPGTFFLIGKIVPEQPALVKRIRDEGHEIGNHTYNHANLKNLGPSAVASELRKTQEAILQACGYRPKLFRPPFGALDLKTMATLANEGLTAVFWSIDTEDWKVSFPHEIMEEVLANLSNGSIILLHDHSPHTAEILPSLIAEIRGRGYGFATVSQLFGLSSAAELAVNDAVVEAKASASPDPPAYFAAQPIPTPRLIASATPSAGQVRVENPGPADAPASNLPEPIAVDGGGEQPASSPLGSSADASPLEPPVSSVQNPTAPAEPSDPIDEIPSPTETFTPTPTATPTFSPSPSPTRTPPPTKTATPTWTITPKPTSTPTPTVEYAVAVDAPKRAHRIYRLKPVESFSQSFQTVPRTRVLSPQPEGGAEPSGNGGNREFGYSRVTIPRALPR